MLKRIKLKRGDDNFCKNIYPAIQYEKLLEDIKNFYPNNNSNKVYQIKEQSTKNLIQSQEDYDFIKSSALKNYIILLINLIDKPPEFSTESSHIFIKSDILFPKKNEIKEMIEESKELTEEEKIKKGIRDLVQSKLQILEKTILENISKKYPKNKNTIIHQGINCSNCGMKNIEGIRYKCTTCLNFNLCEKCEENIEHDDTHVLLKIKEPILNENNLQKKINNSIIILNEDFITEPNEFNFQKTDLINIQNILLTNSTNIVWTKNSKFICIKEKSDFVGNDCIIEEDIDIGKNVNLELVFEDLNKNNNNDKNEYISCYKLVDENDKQIGSIHSFKIIMS